MRNLCFGAQVHIRQEAVRVVVEISEGRVFRAWQAGTNDPYRRHTFDVEWPGEPLPGSDTPTSNGTYVRIRLLPIQADGVVIGRTVRQEGKRLRRHYDAFGFDTYGYLQAERRIELLEVALEVEGRSQLVLAPVGAVVPYPSVSYAA